MAAITIRVYTSPVLTASGNSGFFNLWQPFYLTYTAFTKGVLYVSGSGIAGGTEGAARLTGFSFRMIPANYPRRVLISDFAHPLTRGLPADTVLGSPLAYGPLLFPTDGVALGAAEATG